jgi:ABC-type transporter Mla subunit MlaD
MAGVRIGQVEDIKLTEDYKALLHLRIAERYDIPRGSRFVIRGSLLGNTATLAVEPKPGVQDYLTSDDKPVLGGEAPGLFESALGPGEQEQVDSILASTEQTSRNIEKLTSAVAGNRKTLEELGRLNETLAGMRSTLVSVDKLTQNLNSASESLPRLAAQTESQVSTLSFQANRVLANLETASASGQRLAKNTEGLTGDLRATVNENRETLKAILQNADEASSAIAGLIVQLEETVGDDKIQGNLKAVTDNLASVSARLDATAASVQNLAADPRLAADVRDTVANLKETSASIRNLAGRVETIRIPGERRRTEGTETPRPAPPPATTSLLEPGLAVDSVYDTTLSRLRVDTNYTLLRGEPGRFYRVGFYDLSEGNRLNLQVGQAVGADGAFAYRYGLFGGKFGVGADARTGLFDWRLDLLDPNRFTANARLKAYLNRERTTSVTAGIDSVGNGNRAVFGVQIRN